MRCGSVWCVRQSLRLPVKSRGGTIFDEMVLGQPNVVKPMAFAPRDLIENLAVKAIRCLPPLRRISEVIPKTETYFATVLIHDSWLIAPDNLPLLGTPDDT